MRLNAQVIYAINALIELAGSDEVLTKEQISKLQDIPSGFLIQILTSLRKRGIVESVRGPKGGFKLLRDPGEVTLYDIYNAVCGPLDIVGNKIRHKRNLSKVNHHVESLFNSFTLDYLRQGGWNAAVLPG